MTVIRDALVWLLSFLLVMPPQWVLAADAIVAENGAGVTTTPSGKPMLNIVAPNGAGVSHNTFSDFNVATQGLVINNATGLANTSIGGVIEANPNFSGRAATLILNEVTSSNRSILKGATEIGGQTADYILANPNGITCNGCGFINTPRATLTTGTPVFSGGALTGLSVNTGDVVIEGLGLDATKASKFDIVTRAATINAQVNAQDLGVFAGRQDFDYTNRSGTAKAANGSAKPSFAIDSTALGGMYAGRITLVGTEAGLGVRVAGDMAASTGDMVLTSDGKLELKANLSAATDIALSSTSNTIVAEKDAYAGGTLTATANAGTVTANANASLGAAGDVTVKADKITTGSGAKIVAGMDSGGTLTTSGTLDIQATTKIATGEGFLGGGAAVKLKGPTVDLSRATDDASESVRARGTLSIESGTLIATNGRVSSDGAMTLKGNSPIVLGAGTYASPTTITLTGDSVTSAATLTSDQAVNITSTTGDITNTGTMTAGTTATLTSAADITNSGTIESQTGITVTAAGTLTNTSGAKIKSAQATSVSAGTAITNAGSIYAVGATTVSAPTITNTGSLAAGTDLDVHVTDFTNIEGVLHAENAITVGGYNGVSLATLFDNASAVVETVNGDITINATTIKNRKKEFTYGTSSSSANGWGTLISSCCDYSGDGDLQQQFYFSQYSFSTPFGDWSSVFFKGDPNAIYNQATVYTDSAAATMTSGGDLSLIGTTISNDYSTITAVGNITIEGTTVSNQSISLISSLTWNLAICTAIDFHGGWNCPRTAGRSVAASKVAIQADALIQAGGNLTITASGGTRNGTEKNTIPPLSWSEKVNSSELITQPNSSGLVDITHYADLIPGRDALFNASKDPMATFLFETRADFIDINTFYGSDYFIAKLTETPENISTRLGDAYFDTTLVKQAILRETGRRWLDNTVKDDIQQMKNLLDNGLAAQSGLELAYGVELTPAQIDALTSDIVWYVEEEYQGRTVLVPKVYLASATRATLSDRGAILKADGNVTVTADSLDNDKSVITAGGNVSVSTTGDINSNSAKIKAGGDVTLASTNGDITVTSQVDTYSRYEARQSVIHERSTVEAGGKLTVTAGDDVTVLAADLKAGGDAAITAIGNATIGTRDLQYHNMEDSSSEVVGSSVTAGGDLTLTSGGDARIQASSLTAGNDATVQATGNVVVESGQDTSSDVGDGYSLNTVTQRRATIEAGGNVTLASLAGNASVISSTLDSGGTIQINTPNGALYLGARKDLTDYREQGVKEGAFTSTYINRGEIHETVVPTLMTAAGNIAIVTGDGVIVDYKDTGSLTGSIDQLSQAPGLAWMKDLQSRTDVQWNAVQEAHQSWDYSSQGISPVGAVLISLAVAVATEGMGSGLVGDLIGSELTGEVAIAVADAGFTTLASQAAIAVAGNGGDIGAALKQLGSMDTIKGLATSMITAGLIQGLGVSEALSTSTEGLKGQALKMTEFMNKLKVGIAQASIKATVDSAINGAPLGENLKSAVATAGVNVLMSTVQTKIGDLTDGVNKVPVANMLAHAVAGGLAAKALGNDFEAGAAAGLASAMAAQSGALDGLNVTQAENVSKLLGAVAAAIAGGNAASVAQGASIANSATTNNYLTHAQRARVEVLLGKLGTCRVFQDCTIEQESAIQTELNQLKALSTQNTVQMLADCAAGPSATCQAHIAAADGFQEWALYSPLNELSGSNMWPAEFQASTDGTEYATDNNLNLDLYALDISRQIQSGELTPEEASLQLSSDLQQADGRVKMVGGVIEVAGAGACLSTALACVLGLATAAIGADRVYEGTVTAVTGEDRLSALEEGFVQLGGMSKTDAETLRDDIEMGVAIVTVGAGGAMLIYKGGNVVKTLAKGQWDETVLAARDVGLPNRPPTFEIGASDGGPGVWISSSENLSSAPLAYQKKVTGAPDGTVYTVPDPYVPSGRTSFDGYIPTTNTLIDAKCWACWPRNNLSFSNQSVVEQALRQQRIALETGRTVEWHVPDQEAATRVQNAFATVPQNKRIDPNVIRIVVTPQ